MTRALLRTLRWLGISVAAAVLFGIVNDQVTITISPEYFTVFKRAQFGAALGATGTLDAPARVQAIVVGTLATWWFGLLLGAMLTYAGTRGKAPAICTPRFVRAVGVVMGVTLGLAAIAGAAGYAFAAAIDLHGASWPFLVGIDDQIHAFAVGAWHDGAYLGGAVGTLIEYWRIRRERRQMGAGR